MGSGLLSGVLERTGFLEERTRTDKAIPASRGVRSNAKASILGVRRCWFQALGRMNTRLSISMVVLLAATACAPRAPTTFDLTSASDTELKQHLGENVAMHGRFSLYGKLAPFIQVGGRPVYLEPQGSFSWGERYQSLEGQDVRVTGTLRFAQYPKPPPGDSAVAHASDHFYFEAETAKVELSQK